MKGDFTTIGGSGFRFPNTSWKLVVEAKNKNSSEYRQNLEQLISLYWKPVYVYIRTKWSKTNDDAKELTQHFFTVFMETGALKNFNPGKSRFRTFIKTVLKHFLIDADKRAKAQKRGGGIPFISVEGVREELLFGAVDTSDPADLFDAAWAKTVLLRAMEKMKKRLEEENKLQTYKAFEIFYDNDPQKRKTRKEIAEEFSLTESNIKYMLSNARDMLAAFIREDVRQYVTDESEVDDEIRFLLEKLGVT